MTTRIYDMVSLIESTSSSHRTARERVTDPLNRTKSTEFPFKIGLFGFIVESGDEKGSVGITLDVWIFGWIICKGGDKINCALCKGLVRRHGTVEETMQAVRTGVHTLTEAFSQ